MMVYIKASILYKFWEMGRAIISNSYVIFTFKYFPKKHLNDPKLIEFHSYVIQ